MKQMRYYGFYFPREIFADNRPFFRYCLAEPQYGSSVGVSKDDAKGQLTFLERFPPGVEHRRLSAHEVTVCQIDNPTWEKKGKLVVPQGSLRTVMTLDFGQEIRRICEGKASEPASLDKPDARATLNAHLELCFDPSEYDKTGTPSYSFDICTSHITPQEPKEFHIRSYVTVDGELGSQGMEVAKAAFKLGADGKTPIKFSHLIFTKIG